MRFRLWTHRMILGGAVVIIMIEGVIILNLARLNEMQFRARNLKDVTVATQESLYRLKREARTRAALYERLIQKDMLVEGMIVHRDERGRERGLCDSLLFSAIRFRALDNLGFKKEADEAWAAIDSSRIGGYWWRHPFCRDRSLSRDMLMGVMIALQKSPPGGRVALSELLTEIDQRSGSFSDGPFFISYLSPGPAGLLRHLAQNKGIPSSDWPWVLKQSFSSIEFDALFLRPGYESHLASLGIWLEYLMMQDSHGFNPRSVLGQVERLWTGGGSQEETAIDRERLAWITSILTQENPENLFFSYLNYLVNDEFDNAKRVSLLTELLNMPQFPADRLPMDCDRGADYLWQRRGEEYLPDRGACRMTWSGVDFLWMAGLLVKDP